MLPFVIIVGLTAHRLNFLSKTDTALILSDQGITDQSSIISKGFFIPYRDITGVKGVFLGRSGYTDIETGYVNYYGVKRQVADRYTAWGYQARNNSMILVGTRDAYSIYIKLASKEKYVPKRNNAIYYDEGLIYCIYCGPLDIPVKELIQLIRDRVKKQNSPQEDDEYNSKLRELRSGST